MNATFAVETRDLTRRYGDRSVVDRLNLRVPEAVIFGFLGPNGAGKTTTVRMLCGMLRPTSGRAIVVGLDPQRELDRLKHLMGFMPQQFGLYDYLTVSENLAFYADLYLSSRREARERTAEIMRAMGLEQYRNYEASKRSGGYRQRLALACAVLHRPRIVFLDEPTAGVDPVSRRLFWELLHELNDAGVTVFVTTHYMEEVERCHLVGMLSAGRLTRCGTPRELKAAVESDRELVTVIAAEPERAFEVLRRLPDLIDAYLAGEEVHLAFPRQVSGLAHTREALSNARLTVRLVERSNPTMEDVFVQAAGTGAAR